MHLPLTELAGAESSVTQTAKAPESNSPLSMQTLFLRTRVQSYFITTISPLQTKQKTVGQDPFSSEDVSQGFMKTFEIEKDCLPKEKKILFFFTTNFAKLFQL